jgi:hypothetical protein
MNQKQLDFAKEYGYTRTSNHFWRHDDKVVRCVSCDEEIGGRLFLLFNKDYVKMEPHCLECTLEDACDTMQYLDLGAGTTE